MISYFSKPENVLTAILYVVLMFPVLSWAFGKVIGEVFFGYSLPLKKSFIRLLLTVVVGGIFLYATRKQFNIIINYLQVCVPIVVVKNAICFLASLVRYLHYKATDPTREKVEHVPNFLIDEDSRNADAAMFNHDEPLKLDSTVKKNSQPRLNTTSGLDNALRRVSEIDYYGK